MASPRPRKIADPSASAAELSGRSAPDDARQPTRGDIARSAYDIYLARGGEDGHDVADWLEAERRINAAPGRRRAGESGPGRVA